MQNEHHMTGRPTYDDRLPLDDRSGAPRGGKILIAVAALIVIIGALLWFGSGGDTAMTGDPASPAATAPAEVPADAPAAMPETSAPIAADPATDGAAPPTGTAPAQ